MYKNRVIINGGVAKRLLKRGHILYDVNPNRNSQTQSVYVFFADQFLNEDINDIMNNKSNDYFAMTKRYKELSLNETDYRELIFKEYLQSQLQAVI